ncbi:MAG: hypothetical protein HY961_03340 [Ignavibacteriae bacterium]|nr:hypothetical protein [Ignavibacteriota bacterium]
MKNAFALILLVVFSTCVLAQGKVRISYNPGMSLFNSENSMRTMGEKTIGWFPGMSVAYEGAKVFGLNVGFEYDYSRTSIDHVLEFLKTSANGQPLESLWSDFALTVHGVDIFSVININGWLSLAIGPSIFHVTRLIEIDELRPVGNVGARRFEDGLVSICAGANGAATVQIPFEEGDDYFFFFSSLKLRYLHSIWFDKRGRNVDNYYQSFLVGSICLGVGYGF